MKMLIVGGNFDERGGSSSKIIQKLFSAVDSYITGSDMTIEVINGSYIKTLLDIDFTDYDVLLWAPNISNDEDKLIPDIKKKNPKLFLISTKRVVEKIYYESDVIGRLLNTKSNLGIMITQMDGLYSFKLLDPLGNCHSDTSDITTLSNDMMTRVLFLKQLNRMRSISIGEPREFSIDNEFVDFVKHSATEFSKHANAVNPYRLLGNASTRCSYGFPAQKNDGRIFVTRRNIDKQLIGNEGFVEVTTNETCVEYYGDKKPSVDTPIQVMLFNYYHKINFMIHGHVYIDGAPSTSNKIPCGYIEEFDEVVSQYPDKESTFVIVNLHGHGCLIMADTVDKMWEIKNYVSREFPEY